MPPCFTSSPSWPSGATSCSAAATSRSRRRSTWIWSTADWKSGGDTNFAPIASAFGAIECAGFWDHGKPDKDGVWTTNADISPTLVEWTVRVGADYGRVRRRSSWSPT